MAQTAVHTQSGAMHDRQPVLSSSQCMGPMTGLLPDGDFVGLKVALNDLQLEYFVWIHFFHHVYFNPAPGV